MVYIKLNGFEKMYFFMDLSFFVFDVVRIKREDVWLIIINFSYKKK